MKALCLALLATLLCVRAQAELDGFTPQRRAEIERLMNDPFSVRAEALATYRALDQHLSRADATEALRDMWLQIEQLDDETQTIGDDLLRQISLKQGQKLITPAVADDLKRCTTDSVNARRVVIYGYAWPKAVSESVDDAGVVLPAELAARIRLKISKDEISPLGFSGCGATMRGYGIFPLKRPIP